VIAAPHGGCKQFSRDGREIDGSHTLRYGTRAMMPRLVALAAALTVLAGSACQRTPETTAPAGPAKAAPDTSAVIARYSGKTLTTADAQEAMKKLPGPSRVYLSSPDRKRQFVDNLIMNDLMFEEGKRQGLDADPEITRQVDDFRERLVVQRVLRDLRKRPEISDEEAKQKYDANPNLYSTTQIRASHILVKDEATAKEIRAQLVSNPDSFADVAKEKSTDLGSGRRGGELGLFGPGRMVPEFEAVAFSLKPGEISEVVKTQYGYHVIKVTERKEGTVRPFDQVKAQIKSQIANQRLQDQLDKYMSDLRAKADVKVDDKTLDALTPPPAEPGEMGNPHAGMMGH
jgi:peptidyl-prolyl cis-trans isomerase C